MEKIDTLKEPIEKSEGLVTLLQLLSEKSYVLNSSEFSGLAEDYLAALDKRIEELIYAKYEILIDNYDKIREFDIKAKLIFANNALFNLEEEISQVVLSFSHEPVIYKNHICPDSLLEFYTKKFLTEVIHYRALIGPQFDDEVSNVLLMKPLNFHDYMLNNIHDGTINRQGILELMGNLSSLGLKKIYFSDGFHSFQQNEFEKNFCPYRLYDYQVAVMRLLSIPELNQPKKLDSLKELNSDLNGNKEANEKDELFLKIKRSLEFARGNQFIQINDTLIREIAHHYLDCITSGVVLKSNFSGSIKIIKDSKNQSSAVNKVNLREIILTWYALTTKQHNIYQGFFSDIISGLFSPQLFESSNRNQPTYENRKCGFGKTTLDKMLSDYDHEDFPRFENLGRTSNKRYFDYLHGNS